MTALRWGVPQLVKFFEKLCQRVTTLHDLGMVHLCIKPNNILIDAELAPVLTDLSCVDFEELSREGQGDYRIYAAPEELTGMGTQSPSADVYSLGRVLPFLLLGADPSLQAHDIAPLDSLADAPVGLVRIIRKATTRDAALRYQWVSELATDLEHYEQADTVGMAPQGPAPGEFYVWAQQPTTRCAGCCAFACASRSCGRGAAGPAQSCCRPGARGFRAAAARSDRRRLWTRGMPRLSLDRAGADSQRGVGLGVALTVSIALLTLLLPARGPRPLLFSLTVAGFAAAVLQLEPDRLMLVRWKYTLGHGHPARRAQAARYLARRAYRDLDGVDLSLADLSNADLNRVSFRKANLNRANLSGASLQEATLEGANVSEANLSRADLFGSNIFEAAGWSRTHCSVATVMPSGWHCVAGGPERKESSPAR